MIVSSRETTSEGPPRVHCRSWQLVRRNGKTKAITQNWGIGSFSCHGNFNFPKGHILTCLILHLTRKLCDHFDPSENVAIKATAVSTCRYRSLCNFFDAEMKKIKKVYYVTRRKKGRNEHTKVPNAAMYSTHYAEKQLLCRLVQVLIIGQEHLDGW